MQDKELKKVYEILSATLIWSSEACIVVMPETVNKQVLETMFPYYQIVSIEEILKGFLYVADDKVGMVVTGYSGTFFQDREKENKIQNIIRSNVITRKMGGKRFPLLVLSDSLPNVNFMESNFPWYNYPFSETKSVWSIQKTENGFNLLEHTMKRSFTMNNQWLVKKTTFYQVN